jgi:protein involved in polysaccharide export with SLBB domain
LPTSWLIACAPGFIREPYVAIDVDVYRPFFILGEVLFAGQYAYVPHMTAENAVAIAGGFTPRAYRWSVTLIGRSSVASSATLSRRTHWCGPAIRSS